MQKIKITHTQKSRGSLLLQAPQIDANLDVKPIAYVPFYHSEFVRDDKGLRVVVDKTRANVEYISIYKRTVTELEATTVLI